MTVKISELPAGTEFEAGDILAIVQDNTTKKLDANGNWTFGSVTTASADITGGTIEGTAIGGVTPAAGDFTDLEYTGTLTGGTGVVNLGSGQVVKDASGNVGIGTTAPQTKLGAVGEISAQHSANDSILKFGNNGTLSTISATFGSTGAYTPIRFLTSDTERMRITSAGDLIVGATTGGVQGVQISPLGRVAPTTVSASLPTIQSWNQATSGNNLFVTFFTEGAGGVQRGSIDYGRSAGTVRYNTTSDYRLKENIQPLTGALSKVQAMNPVTYDWKAGGEGEGFIAHELQEIAPYAVSGEKDGEDMQGVDYGKLTTLLVGAVKELTAKVEQLEAQLNAD